ncbi:MAG: NAD-binding protein [Bacteroidetes bacterium]|nr:NAD-binding protein [Bacteroidota bacterium]
MESGHYRRVNYRTIAAVFLASMAVYILLLSLLVRLESTIGNDANIQNWQDAIWWSVVTITTVGYGDTFPVTPGGRIIGFVFLLISLSLYAILIGRITNLISNILENRKMGYYGMKDKGHAIIIGWNQFGRLVTDQLVAAGKKVAIVTKGKENLDLIRESYPPSKVFTLYTDLSNVDILEKINVKESSILFINLDDDTEKLVFILNIRKTYKDLKYIVTLDNADLKDTFLSAGVTYAISKNSLASKLLASYIFEPDVASYNEEIINYATNDEEYDMKEFLVNAHNPYAGKYYTNTFYDLKKDCNAILVGIVKNQEKRVLVKNPEETVTIEVNDYLVMIVNKKAERKLVKLFKTKEGSI